MEVKIAITDDAMFMRNIIKDIINIYDASCIVYEASSGEELLSLVQKHSVDLVTLDITMPGLCGIETLKALKNLRPELPVIMVTAMAQAPLVTEALSLGADDFIVKPFKAANVIEAIDRVLKK